MTSAQRSELFNALSHIVNGAFYPGPSRHRRKGLGETRKCDLSICQPCALARGRRIVQEIVEAEGGQPKKQK